MVLLPADRPAPISAQPAVTAPVPAEVEEPAAVEPSVAAEKDISTLAALGLLLTAPLAGLAFVVFLPLVGFGMLFAAIGSRLGLKFGQQQG